MDRVQRKTARTFELEMLEPRVLLSAAPVATPGTSTSPLEVEQVASDVSGPNSTQTSYDPASQVNDIFSSAAETAQTAGGGDQAAEATHSDSTTTPAPDPKGANTAQESETSVSSGASENAQTTVQQLTETLHSANGPPSGTNTHLTPDEQLLLTNPLVLNSGDWLTGSGTLPVPLINHSGVVSPGNSPGFTNVPTFTQDADGTTIIEIAGTTPGIPTGYDQINVAGLAQLDGTIKIQLLNGFIPVVGNTFTILTWGTRSGAFANWLGTTGIPGHPDLAFKPIYDDVAKTLTLQVIQTPLVIPGVQGAFDTALGSLATIGNLMGGLEGFSKSLPMIGDTIGNLVHAGSGITNALRNQLNSILGALPRQSDVTHLIEQWDNTNIPGGFLLKVKGVLGHYGNIGTDPFWWDITLEIIPNSVNRLLQNVAGALFSAAFGSPPPASVQVTSSLTLDIGLGYDSGFFLQIDHLTAAAKVDVTGLNGFPFNLSPPGGPLSFNVTDGSVSLTASITATPDASILTPNATTGPRITTTTLGTIASSATNVANAFNLTKVSSLDASFTLSSVLTGLAVTFTGTTQVKVHSANLFADEDPDLTIVITGDLVALGQTMSGKFTIKKTATETDIEAENLTLDLNLGAGGLKKRILHADNGSGKFILLDDELAGTASLTITDGPDIPGITISGTTLNLAFNTSSDPVATIDGETVNLPAGQYYRVSGHAVIGLTLPQVSLTGDFVFEPRDTNGHPEDGNEETVIGMSNLTFTLDTGVVALLNVTNGSGAFVLTEDGMAGIASATASLAVPGITVSGTFKVLLNSTT